MKIRRLLLSDFKNHRKLGLEFTSRVTSLVGKNGTGKTNTLDAIYLLGFTKSAFSSSEAQNIRTGRPHYLVEGHFTQDEDFQVKCYYERAKKKVLRVDGVDCDRLADHVGRIPIVMFCPDDSDIIRGAAVTRRKWVDGCISSVDKDYLLVLLTLNEALKQRNALLKQIGQSRNAAQWDLLDAYDIKIVESSLLLARKREAFLNDYIPEFHRRLEELVGELDRCQIHYETQIDHDRFEADFRAVRDRDLAAQRTTLGAHRDDFTFLMGDDPIRRFGSQGQQKSFLIALRLAQFDYLAARTGEVPILLLDDIFDKLDDERITRLVNLLTTDERFDQVIITDARSERTETFFSGYEDLNILEITSNQLTEDA